MRHHQGDDHEGPQAHARHRGGAGRGRAGGRRRNRLSSTREIFDSAAATYDPADFPVFARFGEALVDFAGVQPHERVLDVGCGTGAVLGPAARIAAAAAGVELSPAMAKRAREAAPGADVVVADAAALPFDDGAFDVVFSSFVVFFMDDPTAALREWGRVVAPGGRLVMSTWASGDPRWSWEREVRMPFAREIEPSRLRELMSGLESLERFNDAAKLEAELSAAGFASVEATEHTLEFAFASEAAWWAWLWSHAGRAFLEALSEDARERFRSAAFERMRANREGDGFPRVYTAVFASARRG